MFSAGQWHDTPVYRRESMMPGTTVTGPAIIAEANATTIADPGWAATVTAQAHLVLERVEARPERVAIGTRVDPVMLEVFNNLFMSIAEQMGVRLANTAYSVNIKERLDFSCALFDQTGALIANAPHIPVHLGSMSESVRTIARENAGHIEPGDVFASNAPYNGGTHLPDITVITPVFDAASPDILFYVASRGHHADIGGMTPGSMPPHSRTIDEEGVLIDNWKLVSAGRLLEAETGSLLRSGRFPARNVEQNLADLRAQVAANEKGVQELRGMVEHFGLDVVQAYMRHVQDNAEEAVRRVIDVLTAGACRHEMDNGAVIDVRIAIDQAKRVATLDFSGSSPQLPNNYNAPSAVAMSAVLYVFRTLVDDDIPLNAGCLKPLHVIIPHGLAVATALPGRSRRRQRGDLAMRHGCALHGPRRARRLRRHDEQLHVRQRALPVLRNGGRRLRSRPGIRRHGLRADAYDELAPHRPGSAGVALPRRAGAVRAAPRLRWGGSLARRRRRASTGAFSGADDGGDRGGPTAHAAPRVGRRR